MAEHSLNLKATIDTSEAEAKLKGLDKTGGIAEVNKAASEVAKSVDSTGKLFARLAASHMAVDALKQLGDEGKALADGMKTFQIAIAAGLNPLTAGILAATSALTHFITALQAAKDAEYERQMDAKRDLGDARNAYRAEQQSALAMAEEGTISTASEDELLKMLEESRGKSSEARKRYFRSLDEQVAREAEFRANSEEPEQAAQKYRFAVQEAVAAKKALNEELEKEKKIEEALQKIQEEKQKGIAEEARQVQILLDKLDEEEKKQREVEEVMRKADIAQLESERSDLKSLLLPGMGLTNDITSLSKFGFNMGEVEDDTEKVMQDQLDIQRQILDITRRIEVLQESKGNTAIAG